MYDVTITVRSVGSADEDQLEALQANITQYGGIDPAVIHWPRDGELGIQFQIEEEMLAGLLQPVVAVAAA